MLEEFSSAKVTLPAASFWETGPAPEVSAAEVLSFPVMLTPGCVPVPVSVPLSSVVGVSVEGSFVSTLSTFTVRVFPFAFAAVLDAVTDSAEGVSSCPPSSFIELPSIKVPVLSASAGSVGEPSPVISVIVTSTVNVAAVMVFALLVTLSEKHAQVSPARQVLQSRMPNREGSISRKRPRSVIAPFWGEGDTRLFCCSICFTAERFLLFKGSLGNQKAQTCAYALWLPLPPQGEGAQTDFSLG